MKYTALITLAQNVPASICDAVRPRRDRIQRQDQV